MEKSPLLNHSPRRADVYYLSLRLKVYLIAVALLTTYSTGYLSSTAVSPGSYALCSPPGRYQIYTVDSNNTRVECIYVEGSHILMAGNHIQLPARMNRVRFKPEDAIALPGLSGVTYLLSSHLSD
jgi:hypothetical protein